MPRPVTEPVLRALVSRARDDEYPADVLAVHGSPQWSGERTLDTDAGRIRVVRCESVLAVREVLTHREESGNGDALVILTDRDEEELGQEVLTRVWRQRLLRPSRWEAAKTLFRVDRLDPALADARWLVELLVDVAPPRGYPPPPSGFLEFETAWRTFLRHGLRLDIEEPTLEDLLRWGETEDAPAALTGFPERHLGEIAERLREDVGESARHLLRIVRDGRGEDLVPLGLVADALWRGVEADDPAVLTARVRFEGPVGSNQITSVAAREWGEAATALVKEAAARGEETAVSRWLSRAEEILADLDALDLAVTSDVLPAAFTKRLIKAGRALRRAVDDPREDNLAELVERVQFVERHLRAQNEEGRDRVRRVKMAARLVRRMVVGGPETESGFEGIVSGYVADGAWADTAREEIGHGETVSSLSEAYSSIIDRIDQERAERDSDFAEAFSSWSEVLPPDSEPILPIERVLERVVAPVVKRAPTLLLVLDGLSYSESTQLFADVRGEGWTEQAPNGKRLPYVAAAVPTVTAVSRASLLSGKLTVGGQDAERSGFESHSMLRDAAGGEEPRLFHKGDLKIEQGAVAPEVRDTILDPSLRAVGVVVNAVDDHLAKGSQLRLANGLRGLRPLRPLLDTAAEAGRAVIIASDHGHVLEHGSEARVTSGASERWRPANEPPGEGEVELSGPRVLKGDGRIVAPAVESIRYVAAEKRGYHGGATPQEVLCPLAVFTPGGVTLEGWEPPAIHRPAWWEIGVQPPDTSSLSEIERAEPVVEPDGQGVLFTEEGRAVAPSVDVEGWIGELLESPVFEKQREAAGRQALDDESVATFLMVLDRMGGVAPPSVLSDVTELPPSRLRTKLEALRRMLNLDGYPVLTLEADGTARLNREMLETQFQLEI